VHPQQSEQQHRPVDVGTGFGLWLTALPLLVIGQGVDTVLSPERTRGPAVFAVTAIVLVALSAVVLTFLFLMWHRYRWARTLLTAGGATSVVYVITSLFTVQRSMMDAVAYAVTGIVGSVLIVGGIFLLHRKDAHAYFTR
jgi:hypothetical protein